MIFIAGISAEYVEKSDRKSFPGDFGEFELENLAFLYLRYCAGIW